MALRHGLHPNMTPLCYCESMKSIQIRLILNDLLWEERFCFMTLFIDLVFTSTSLNVFISKNVLLKKETLLFDFEVYSLNIR